MFNYFFKNMNTLFLICALAFISIANAQEVSAVDNKGTIKKILIPTRAELFDTTGDFEITDDGATIPFNTQGIIDLNDYSTSSNAPYTFVKILKPGTYKVTYRVTAQITSGGDGGEEYRSGAQYILLKKTNGSISEVPGSASATYHRKTALSKDTANASQILDLVADDELKVRGNRYAGTSTISTVANGSSFLVERIKLEP